MHAFCSFLDSAVCRGALTKGRSASRALQPGLKRACAVSIAHDLYPSWVYSPTRLNVADDPLRDAEPRKPVPSSLVSHRDVFDISALSEVRGARRFASNWIRLVLLLLCCTPADGYTFGPTKLDFASLWISLTWISHYVPLCPFWFWVFGVLLGFSTVGVCVCGSRGPSPKPKKIRTPNPRKGLFRFAMAFLLLISSASGMPIEAHTEVERQRAAVRETRTLATDRVVRPQTRTKRAVYLERFKKWLLEDKGISFRGLIQQRPPDAERVSSFLVEYGKQLFQSGKSYGIYAETINAVAIERPLLKRLLTPAWDLAFAWLADEPYSHHPAMPLSLMASMVVIALV